MSKFSQLSSKLQAKGYSKSKADAITATIGRRKFGAKKMAQKAAAGRAKNSKTATQQAQPTQKAAY